MEQIETQKRLQPYDLRILDVLHRIVKRAIHWRVYLSRRREGFYLNTIIEPKGKYFDIPFKIFPDQEETFVRILNGETLEVGCCFELSHDFTEVLSGPHRLSEIWKGETEYD